MKEIIAAGVLFLIALVAFVLSVCSFCEKGFLFNNAYLHASKQERDSMDKKPYYRQSAIVFLFIGCIFSLNGCSLLFHTEWISYLASAAVIGVFIYAVTSSVIIENQNKEK